MHTQDGLNTGENLHMSGVAEELLEGRPRSLQKECPRSSHFNQESILLFNPLSSYKIIKTIGRARSLWRFPFLGEYRHSPGPVETGLMLSDCGYFWGSMHRAAGAPPPRWTPAQWVMWPLSRRQPTQQWGENSFSTDRCVMPAYAQMGTESIGSNYTCEHSPSMSNE